MFFYINGVKGLKEHHNSRWFIKYPGFKDNPEHVERMARNLKYGKLLNSISEFIKEKESYLKIRRFNSEVQLSEEIVKQIELSTEYSVDFWIACHLQKEDPLFDKYDCFF